MKFQSIVLTISILLVFSTTCLAQSATFTQAPSPSDRDIAIIRGLMGYGCDAEGGNHNIKPGPLPYRLIAACGNDSYVGLQDIVETLQNDIEMLENGSDPIIEPMYANDPGNQNWIRNLQHILNRILYSPCPEYVVTIGPNGPVTRALRRR